MIDFTELVSSEKITLIFNGAWAAAWGCFSILCFVMWRQTLCQMAPYVRCAIFHCGVMSLFVSLRQNFWNAASIIYGKDVLISPWVDEYRWISALLTTVIMVEFYNCWIYLVPTELKMAVRLSYWITALLAGLGWLWLAQVW